jgi:membrane-associated phospholipid phosphatase
VAFAGAAGADLPGTAWALGPLAGVVALSRPAGGRHYPSDVIGGIVTGAVAAAIVHRLGKRARRQGSSPNSDTLSTPVASADSG